MSGFWNYRAIYIPGEGDHPEPWIEIHSAHYAANQRDLPPDEAIPRLISADPMPVYGGDIEGVRWVLGKMMEALDKPVLEQRGDKFVPHVPDAKEDQ